MKNITKSIFLVLFALSSVKIQSMALYQSAASAASNLSSGISGMSYQAKLGLAGACAVSMYALSKYRANAALSKLKAEEEAYAKEQIKVTRDTIFVFDVNDVIIEPDFARIWSIIKTKILSSHKMGLASAMIRPYLYYTVMRLAVKGSVPEEYLDSIQKNYPQFKDLIGYGLELANAQKPVKGMFELLEGLNKQGHKLLILSNICSDKLNADTESSPEMLKKEFPIFGLFERDGFFLTTKENGYMRKPQPGFYQDFLEKFKKLYGEENIKNIIFIDDRLKNVKAAREQGINSLWFISAEDLTRKLAI